MVCDLRDIVYAFCASEFLICKSGIDITPDFGIVVQCPDKSISKMPVSKIHQILIFKISLLDAMLETVDRDNDHQVCGLAGIESRKTADLWNRSDI